MALKYHPDKVGPSSIHVSSCREQFCVWISKVSARSQNKGERKDRGQSQYELVRGFKTKSKYIWLKNFTRKKLFATSQNISLIFNTDFKMLLKDTSGRSPSKIIPESLRGAEILSVFRTFRIWESCFCLLSSTRKLSWQFIKQPKKPLVWLNVFCVTADYQGADLLPLRILSTIISLTFFSL